MKIIGAGFARTGTMSMYAALGILGYRAYHLFEALRNFEIGHMDMWNDFMEGKSEMDWHKLYEEYDASTDLPSCIYWREQMDAFPEAKVVLTKRDPEAWWNSYKALTDSQVGFVDSMLHLPRFAAMDRLAQNFDRIWFRIEPDHYERESAIARFIEHNQDVIATVPPERLLVYEVTQGWEPLCKFLEVSIPDEPFPHENAGVAQVEALMGELVQMDMQKYGPPPQK